MAHLVSFRTALFDIRKETPNPINPIAGESVLAWLKPELEKNGYRVSAPDTEDWGWYVDVLAPDGVSYMVGASADADDAGRDVEWIVQLHRERSFMDRMRGRSRLQSDDPLSALVERIVRAEPGMSDVSVDRRA